MKIKKHLALASGIVAFLTLAFGLYTLAPTTVVEATDPPTIDGVVDPEYQLLGTSTTSWGGGTSVDVYGYVVGDYLYVAYEADMTEPGWATACVLNVNGNFYYRTPQTASWPDAGYTILEMVFPRVMQTDGSGWVDLGGLASNGVEYWYTDMFSVDNSDCAAGLTNNNIAEFKIPLSLLTYAGNDGQVRLSGQYWQYDFSAALYISIPIPPPKTISGGGHILKPASKRKDWLDISFGGDAKDYGSGVFEGEWQINFHNVREEWLDKGRFHSTNITDMNFYAPTSNTCIAAMNMTMTGTLNGEPGYTVIFRAGDSGSPNNVDTVRVQINGSGESYDTYVDGFDGGSNCVGSARTDLDKGNITIVR
ncbi:hypothetical protein GTO10_01800 [Candidatus Saccharibacteria bacterium]|nr:hypothetical protein [Candidatus Saccharibacteria bacterium]